MKNNDNTSFKERLETLAIPYILITSVATSLAKLEGVVSKNGFRLLAVSAAIISIAWLYHVFNEHEPSIIHGGTPQPKYKTKHRSIAFFLFLFTCLSLFLVFKPKPQFELPEFSVMVWNHLENEVHLNPYGFFSLSIPVSPITEDQVGSGKIELIGGGQAITAPPNKAVTVNGKFVASHLYEGFYNRGDVNFRIVLSTIEGKFLNGAAIPFAEDWIIGEHIYFEVGLKPNKANSADVKNRAAD